jgi:hypothetical protein
VKSPRIAPGHPTSYLPRYLTKNKGAQAATSAKEPGSGITLIVALKMIPDTETPTSRW